MNWCQQEEISKTWDQEIFCPIWVIWHGVWQEDISGQICPIVLWSVLALSWDPAHDVITPCPTLVITHSFSYWARIMEVKIILLFCHLPSSQSQLQPPFSPLSLLSNIWSTVSRARNIQVFQPQLRSKFLTDDINFGDGNVRRDLFEHRCSWS